MSRVLAALDEPPDQGPSSSQQQRIQAFLDSARRKRAPSETPLLGPSNKRPAVQVDVPEGERISGLLSQVPTSGTCSLSRQDTPLMRI
jgi:hypothetical protein